MTKVKRLFFCSRTESKRSKNDVSSRTESARTHAETDKRTDGQDIKVVRASTTSSRRIAPFVGLLLLVLYW